jgi:hypothetical protein
MCPSNVNCNGSPLVNIAGYLGFGLRNGVQNNLNALSAARFFESTDNKFSLHLK